MCFHSVLCGRQNISEEVDPALTYHERQCYHCKKQDHLYTETERHNRRNFLKRKHVHCGLCGGGTFEITQEIWDDLYAYLPI